MPPHPDLRTAYSDRIADDTGPAVSQVERVLLCASFREVGPEAPTLCGGWDTYQLANHLVRREASPLGSLWAVVPGVGSSVEQQGVGTDFSDLVDTIAAGPPRLSVFSTRTADRALNTLEFFVHHEDVRRAAPGWQPRTLPRWAEDQLWSRLRLMAKLVMRRSPVPVQLVRTDTGDMSTARKGSPPAVIRALPSEMALFAHGRSEVARVDLEGPEDAVRRLHEQRFSV